MTTGSDHTDRIPHRQAGRVSLDELASRDGVQPIHSMDDLACDLFDNDDELVLHHATLGRYSGLRILELAAK